jgi:hypothetical protein
MTNLINCGTCGYPLTPEERTSLIERDGVMVKPAPMTKDEAISTERALDLALEALSSIDIYLSDTLTGRVNPEPATYKQWLIDGIMEARNRSRAAITAIRARGNT